jgi:pyrophosphatase PpaX
MTPKKDKRVILFDLDGTLIDTTDLILSCFHHCWEKVCGITHPRAALLQTFGMPLKDAMWILVERANEPRPEPRRDGETSVLIEQLVSEYRTFNLANHDTLARPFLQMRDALVELRNREYALGVVTSKGRDLAVRGLNLCSLADLFDTAVFLEDTNRHKPDPAPVLEALSRLNAPPHRAAYVGDSAHDILAGRRAGVQTIAALWGPGCRNDLEQAMPDCVVSSIGELLEVFS